ncbi:MAG: diguanylate cyclase [Phycisphaerales bacterium]
MSHTRLLLVEDDSDHQRLLLRALVDGRPTIEIKIVASAPDFLDAIGHDRYSCVILDFNIGPNTASDLLEQAGPLLEGTPVVVISSSTTQSVVIESMRHGVSDYVPKHDAICPGLLWKAIDRAVSRADGAARERRRAERRIRELRRAADRDLLTGLWNRRYAARLLARRCSESEGTQRAMVMVDIDHFKSVNDRFGHEAGDGVLRHVAQVLQQSASQDETVVRWGGEEFLIIMPVQDVAAAWIFADSLRRGVAEQPPVVASGPIEVSISVGVAVGSSREDADQAVRRADDALYFAKNRGRDRVCTSHMVQMLAVAEQVAARAIAEPADRVRAFLAAVHHTLGTVQREHVGPHSELVRRLGVAIGGAMRLRQDELNDIALGAIAHDIGKVSIPETLLAKASVLSDDEKRFVDEHARLGSEIAEKLGLPSAVVRVIADHHLRYDSAAGKPGMARREGTPRSIITLADAFAAMVEDRPYSPPRSVSQVLCELRRERGGQFDPDVVETAHFVDHGPLLANLVQQAAA